MFPYAQSVTPAARTHMEAQLAFINDMSRSMCRTVQQFSDLNIQLAHTMLEEATQTSQQLMTANRPTEAMAAAANRAQPAVDKLRAYQQHLSRIAADTQVDLSRVAGEHVESTSRTAKALAEEVARATSEETERTLRSQQSAMEKFSDPFMRGMHGNGTAAQRNGSDGADGDGRRPAMHAGSRDGQASGADHAGGQSGGQSASQPATTAAAAQSAAQASSQGGRQSAGARKDG